MTRNASTDVFGRAMRDSAVPMLLVAPEGAITYANDAAGAFFGLGERELTASTWQQLTHPDDLDVDLAHVDALLRDEADSYRLVKRYLHADGSTRVGDLVVTAIRDGLGAVEFFVSQIVDISAEQRALDALAESERRFHLMFDRSADLVLVIAPDLTIEWLSPSVESLLGAPAEEYLGTVVMDHIHPDDREAIMSAVAAVGEDATVRFRNRLRRADGQYRWFATSLATEHAPTGTGLVLYGSSLDIHETVLAEQELERSRAMLRGILDNLPDPWVLLDPVRDDTGRIVDFVYVDANTAACAINRISRSALLGTRLLELLPEHEDQGLLAAYAYVVDTGYPLALDDEPFPDRLDPTRIRRYDNRAVAIGGQLSFTWRDVTDRFELRQLLDRQAHHDQLTGLPNRARLSARMDEVFGRTPRTGERLAVLYCDLDAFKAINDTRGHAVGDTVLRAVAERMSRSVRAQDTVARLGGDEVVVILEGVHTVDDALAVAAKIRTAVAEPIDVGGVGDTGDGSDGGAVTTSMSIGIALTERGTDPKAALQHADAALYQAKEAGRDRAAVYDG